MFEICGFKVEKGTKAHLNMEYTKDIAGDPIGMPFTVINGVEEGPVLLLDGCVHGDEPEGPLAIINIINQVDPQKLRGTIIAIPAINSLALASGKRGNPRDEHNYDLNRIYPGKPDQFVTGRLAYKHFTEILQKANMEISVHGGGNHSFMIPAIFNNGSPESLELVKAMGPDWSISMKNLGTASPQGQARPFGIASINAEIGGTSGAHPDLLKKNVDTLLRAFYNVMYHYKMLEGTPEYRDHWYVGHQDTVYAEADGMLLPGAFEWKLGQMVKKGEPLLKLVNLRGETVQIAEAPSDGIPFGLHTYPSVCTGEWMVFLANVERVEELV